jgi:hypothetical protein
MEYSSVQRRAATNINSNQQTDGPTSGLLKVNTANNNNKIFSIQGGLTAACRINNLKNCRGSKKREMSNNSGITVGILHLRTKIHEVCKI